MMISLFIISIATVISYILIKREIKKMDEIFDRLVEVV